MNFGTMMELSGRLVSLPTRRCMSERQITLDQARKLVPWLQETFDGLAPLRDRMQQLGREARWWNLTARRPMGHRVD